MRKTLENGPMWSSPLNTHGWLCRRRHTFEVEALDDEEAYSEIIVWTFDAIGQRAPVLTKTGGLEGDTEESVMHSPGREMIQIAIARFELKRLLENGPMRSSH